MTKVVIISLGGSLIVPKGIDSGFLAEFKVVIEKYIQNDYRFVIYCGGGRLARNFQQAASMITKPGNDDLDWLGIHATRLNAELMRVIFKNESENFILENPNSKINFRKNILIAAGWKPGNSTDYDAIVVAKNLGIKEIINMSNVDYVYDRDPKKFKGAVKFEKISWKDLTKLIGTKWEPGMNIPFDPIAAIEAKKSGITVKIIGPGLKNLQRLLNGGEFKGTTVE